MSPQDLAKITKRTLEHYNQRAEEFWEGTRDQPKAAWTHELDLRTFKEPF